MSTVLFDQLQTKLRSEGPSASIEYLCQHLRDSGEYNSLFYALLMKKRLELGAVPIPTGPASDLPAAVHAEYEDAIRSSAPKSAACTSRRASFPRRGRSCA